MPVVPTLLLLLPAVSAIFNGDATQFGVQDRVMESSPQLEQEITILRERVQNAQANEEQLAAVNEELRHEVNGWVDVGAKVMSRERQMVNALQESQGVSSQGLQSLSPLDPAIISGFRVPQTSQKLPLAFTDTSAIVSKSNTAHRLPATLITWKLFVLVFTVLAIGAFLWIRSPAAVSRLLSGEQLLEISELQLEGAPMGFSEAYLILESAAGTRSRTRVAEQVEDSSVLRFQDEVLTFPFSKGGPCIINVFRRDDLQDAKIGTVTLEPSALVRSGSQASCPYFRFRVEGEAQLMRQQMFVAMRVRKLGRTWTKARPPAKGKDSPFAV
jgi:hypothetical protein